MKLRFCITAIALTIAIGSIAATDYTPYDRMLIEDAIRMIDNKVYDRPIEVLDSISKIYPEDTTLRYEVMYANYLKGDIDKALEIGIEQLKKANEPEFADADFRQFYPLIGTIYDHKGMADESIDIFLDGIHRYPDCGTLYFNLGVTYSGLGRNDEAIKTFEDGIANDPYWGSNYRGLIATNLKQGNLYKTIETVLAYILIDNFSDDAINLSEIIPLIVCNKISLGEPDENGKRDIQILMSPESSPEDLLLLLSLSSANEEKEYENDYADPNTYEGIVRMLKKVPGLAVSPALKYINKMAEAGHDDAFWRFILFPSFKADTVNWLLNNEKALNDMVEWIKENPYIDFLKQDDPNSISISSSLLQNSPVEDEEGSGAPTAE